MKRYRFPRTAQEMRADDGSELVRPRRRKHRLPTWLDDIACGFERSWKRWRKTKWKAHDRES